MPDYDEKEDLLDRLVALGKRRKGLSLDQLHRELPENMMSPDEIEDVLERLEGATLEQRRAWTQEALQRTFALARRTDYGCIVRGGDTLASWPLLEKEMLRGRLHSFVTGREWFGAPAVTGAPV